MCVGLVEHGWIGCGSLLVTSLQFTSLPFLSLLLWLATNPADHERTGHAAHILKQKLIRPAHDPLDLRHRHNTTQAHVSV